MTTNTTKAQPPAPPQALYGEDNLQAAIERQEAIYIAPTLELVHVLEELGVTATTSGEGFADWTENLGGHFEGSYIVIIPGPPSLDGKAERQAMKVAYDCRDTAFGIKVLILPDDLKAGFGAWVETPRTREEFDELVRCHASPYKTLTPEEAQAEKLHASIMPLPSGCQLKWATDKHTIYAQARRLRSSSDGQVKGELEIRHEAKNGKQTTLLVPATFNFSADKTRTEYAKRLAEKTKDTVKVDWVKLFDDLTERVIDFTREGAPCVEVSLDCEGRPPKQLIEGLVYEGVQNIIYGDKGVNKSTIAYLLGLTLTLPWIDNPLNLRVPRERKRVLVLDWETNQAIFEYYLARLRRGMNIPMCSLHYRRCELPLTDDIEAIQEHVHRVKADVIIIDSLGAAAGGAHGELKGSEAPLLFNKALRSLDCTSLIIAQTAKANPDGASNQKTIYGSTYFRYYARNIFELWGDEGNHGFDVQHFGLFHRDCNLGKRIDTIGIRIEFDGDQAITVAREAASVGELKAKMTARAIVLDALKDGAKTVKALTEITDLTRNTVDQTLSRLRQAKPPQLREVAGDTEKGENLWGLAQDMTKGI